MIETETTGRLAKSRACTGCEHLQLCRANQDIHDSCETINLRGDLFEGPPERRSRWKRTLRINGKVVRR